MHMKKESLKGENAFGEERESKTKKKQQQLDIHSSFHNTGCTWPMYTSKESLLAAQ